SRPGSVNGTEPTSGDVRYWSAFEVSPACRCTPRPPIGLSQARSTGLRFFQFSIFRAACARTECHTCKRASMRSKNRIALRRCGKLQGVKPRALLVAQLFLKLGNGDLDRLHRNPGDVEPCLDRLQARRRHTRRAVGTSSIETTRRSVKRAFEIIECGLLSGGRLQGLLENRHGPVGWLRA